MQQHEYHGNVTYTTYANVFTEAKTAGHQHWINNSIPVPHNLKRFFEESKHKMPTLIPRLDRRTSRYNGHEYVVYADIGLAFSDAPDLNVGDIGLEMDAQRNLVYYVKSDQITNDKFATHSEGYHIKKSKNYATAVKSVRQYIKPFTIRKLEYDKRPHYEKAIAQIRQPAQQKMYEALTIPKGDLFEELKHMMNIGYTPISQTVKQTLETFRTELAEMQELERYSPTACFVWLKPNSVEYKMQGEEVTHVAHTSQDVPEWIRDKVAVLQIGNAGTSIKDVGIKVSDTMYWVFQ